MYCCEKCGALIDEGYTEYDCPDGCYEHYPKRPALSWMTGNCVELKMTKQKELLVRVTGKDCRWEFYVGSGKGGQKRNKTHNCARCTHPPSGAVGKAEDGRSKEYNKQKAFERMANTELFQKWIRLESMRAAGTMDIIEENVRKQVRASVVEVKDEGKWVKAPKDLQIQPYEVT